MRLLGFLDWWLGRWVIPEPPLESGENERLRAEHWPRTFEHLRFDVGTNQREEDMFPGQPPVVFLPTRFLGLRIIVDGSLPPNTIDILTMSGQRVRIEGAQHAR